MNETEYMKRIQIAAADDGVMLYRNNVGQCMDQRGRRVKFGLAVGSSDLIGYTPIVVRAADVGRTLAVFTSVECKGPATRVTDEQRAWLAAVEKNGGIARLMRVPENWTPAAP